MNNDLVEMRVNKRIVFVGTLEECMKYCEENGLNIHRCTFTEFKGYKQESEDAIP